MKKLFGTDGVRGEANKGTMSPSSILQLALAAGFYFTQDRKLSHRPMVVIGKDTRLSGYMVESALTAGFVSMGMDVRLLGPLPTPAVGMLTKSLRADLGVMISASHNPAKDNGIKFFNPDGYKLSDIQQHEIETLFHQTPPLIPSLSMGKAKRVDDAAGRYIEFAKNSVDKHVRLDGLKIVIDCAHGAAYKVAPSVLWELGADVIEVGCEPNGLNINDKCGATHLPTLQQEVLNHQADVGIALDGDADRLILVDNLGHILDGDHILALIATHWQKEGRLKTSKVIATQMSNLGLENYLKALGLELLRTPVGDRPVLEAMRQTGSNVGGEQSGHILLTDFATTGDGLVAALQVLALMVKEQRSLHEMGRLFMPLPQLIKNVRITSTHNLKDANFSKLIKKWEDTLTPAGRILIRPSGTEPLIRLMAEGENTTLLKDCLEELSTELESQTSVA